MPSSRARAVSSRFPLTGGTPRRFPFGAAFLAAALAIALGARSATAQQAPTRADSAEVLATFGGERITMVEVRQRAARQLDEIEQQYRRARDGVVRAVLDTLVQERLIAAEARRRGTTPEQLVASQPGAATEPTQAEIAAWFEANEARLGGRSLQELAPQIAGFLRAQRRRQATERLEAELRESLGLVVRYEPYRIPLEDAGSPALGPADARVTIVEFSDFQCPFCQRINPTLKRILAEHPGQVRLVFRHFPIAQIHPNAFQAAEASVCAQDQGKFWEMHDLLFAEQDRLAVADLKEKAARLGLDRQQFDGCLDSGRHGQRVQNDFQAGQRAGVNGTPALFVNGIALPAGAVPYEMIAAAVRQELARVR